eukprot:TRINITY_DN12326_c3_g2_i1.p1 TRINITY_DN12326_c3_g2~~TRINITY_DN12326_c3_g2_i1.p1  ORF type:complete len:1308 (+),score=386.87 TRINITY_DN12326_c3_g2_i1:37-3924(+)
MALMAWDNLSMAAPGAPNSIFTKITGHIPAGGMLACLGVSSTGKSLLMQALGGRAQGMMKDGVVVMDGVKMPLSNLRGDVALEDDMLIGELTVRESLRTALNLKQRLSKDESNEKIDQVLKAIGLSHVADSVIGTILRRGLSGGQQRRVSVAMEFMVTPTVLLLDEPTSGLDATTAFTLIEYLKTLAQDSKGRLGVMVSLQQPNTRLMELFDCVSILGHGGQIFFGDLTDAKVHFAKLGFAVPEGETPTDYYLQVSDVPPDGDDGFDFPAAWQSSSLAKTEAELVQSELNRAVDEIPYINYDTSSWHQYRVLLQRNLTVGRRDVTLYWLQLMLHSGYGFMVGAVFFSLNPFVIGDRINDPFNGVTWITFISTYMHVFKSHFLVVNNARFHHEYANNAYRVLPYFLAELTSTMIWMVVFLPGITICYFMMGLPSEAFAFNLLTFYTVCLASEGSIHFVTQFFTSSAYAVVAAQAFLVMLSTFTTGSLIREDKVPDGWAWLQELSYYYWCSKASAVRTFDEITYSCAQDNFAALVNDNTTCTMPLLGVSFECDVASGSDGCTVSGRQVLEVYKGIDGPSYWDSYGRLVAVAVGFRLLVLILYYYPVATIIGKIKSLLFAQGSASELPPRRRLEPAYKEEAPQSAKPARNKSSIGQHVNTAQQLVWRDLTLTLPNGKVLIDHVDGIAQGGRCLSLMGPSGAGKTTLLNALSGRATYAKVAGAVTFNGKPITRDDLDFVPQFDELSSYFTVHENVYYTGLMKRRVNEQLEEISQRVDELLVILGLSQVAHERPTALTGGQRKRVSIAMGLVARAPILFLDEPTTGLDSAAAYTIVKYITKIARNTGVVTIMTIHQPSAAVFAALDDLYLLDRGQLTFAGSMETAKEYFQAVGFRRDPDENPADFYLDLISYKPVEVADKAVDANFTEDTTWNDLYMTSSHVQDVAAMTQPASQKSDSTVAYLNEISRFGILLRKSFINHTRYPVYKLRALQLLAQGLFIGTMYWRTPHSVTNLTEISGGLFLNIWVVLFSVVAGAPTFCDERRLAQQDYVNGAYSLASYAISQFIASIPFTFGCALVYETPLHFMAGFNDQVEAFSYAVLTAMALMLLMEAIVLTVVEGLKNPMLSTTFSMIVLGMLFLFPGFFLPVDDMPPAVGWVPYIIPSTWGTRGSLQSALKGQQYDLPGELTIGGSSSIDGNVLFVEVFKYDSDVNKWNDWLVLVAWVLFWRGAHYLMLLRVNRNFGRQQQTVAASNPALTQETLFVKADGTSTSMPVEAIVDADDNGSAAGSIADKSVVTISI